MFKYSLFVAVTMNYLILIFTFVGVANGNELSNQGNNDRKLFEGHATELRLTKLLNLELGGESEKGDTDLRKIVLAAVKTNFEESSDAARTSPYIPQDNHSQKEIAMVLKELYAEITALKKNVSSLVTQQSSECLIQSDILEGKSFPVGTNYHRLCPPSTLIEGVNKAKKYFPRSCKEILEKGNNVSGIYQIQPRQLETPLMVLCDMETKGGGWTHIQKRYDGTVDFFLNWREYKFGFGDLGNEFWLGLENIYKLTGFEVNELLVEIVDRENKTGYAHYKGFGIGSAAEGYPLNVLRDFSGDAGDSLSGHRGAKFSTKDFDQDSDSGNCAVKASGAWWYTACYSSNLNGKFINAVVPEHFKYHGIHWHAFNQDYQYCLAKTRMMVRPVG